MAESPIPIFISYAHADRNFVQRLETDLRQKGFAAWVDFGGLSGGQQWRRELQAAIDRSRVLLVVLSPDAVASTYVQIEYSYATDVGKLVIPLYYRACNVPMELRTIQWIDFQNSYEQGLVALLQTLQQHTGTPAPTFSPPVSLHTAQSAPQQTVERPWNVPFARNPFFTGRGQLLERLHEQLSNNQRAALNQPVALSGLGGVGKTQTAIEYAYRYRDEYSAVLWARADSRETLTADYVAIARLLTLPGLDSQDQMQVVTTVKRWLQEHEGWLLILDNADDLSLLPGFLPQEGKGYLLFTTRVQATGKLARSIPVEKMEMAEALLLLLHRAKVLEEDEPLDNVSAAERKAAQTLVEELDGLPLALEQAGAYIEDTECSLADYLALYSRHRLALLKRQSSMSSDYPYTVASTWGLSFSQVEQANPAAADLLRLCAFLHPDAIPEAILTGGASELGPRLQEVANDSLFLNEAIQVLRRYSLVKRDPEAKLLNLHRLVQVVLKESLDIDTRRQWAERAVRVVNAAFPQEELTSWERCEPLLPHALLCAELIAQYNFSFPEAARLLHATGRYMYERNQYAQAEQLLKQALALRQNTLGAENAETASTLNALADVYTNYGELERAEQLLTPALPIYEGVLGPEHPQVAFALHTLAGVYMFTDRYAQAEKLFQRALSILEHAFGPNHLFVAESLNDLALLYRFQGKYAKAEPLFQRALALYEQALGPEHPFTLTTLFNLARLFYQQGKYGQAEALIQRTLAVAERKLGEEHFQTLLSLFNLGRLRIMQGRYQDARTLLQRAYALLERVAGPKNTITLEALLAQADLALLERQDAEAESLYQRALTDIEQALGPTHRLVAQTLTGLAQLSMYRRDYTQSESLLQRALIIYEQGFGPTSPYTATVLDAQGHLALLQGQEEQAASLLQQALSIREQSLGPDHPDVAQTLQHLAELTEKQGKAAQAQSLYQRALAIREQALGAEHPDTIATQEAIGRLQQTTVSQEGSESLP